MLVAEMISDKERIELIKLINQFLIGRRGKPPTLSSVQNRLGQVQQSKIGGLAKNYYALDLQNKSHVTDDDKVMARRSYFAAKNRT